MKILILLVLLGSIPQKINTQDMEELSSCSDNISDQEWATFPVKDDFNTSSEEEMSLLPKSFDWRDRGFINPVRDQGVCGCCWAMAAIGAIESAYFIFNGFELDTLSPQHLIDCVGANQGCESGSVRQAFVYASDSTRSPGLLKEEDYPYKATQGPCKLPVNYQAFPIDGYAVLHAYADVITVAVTRQPLVVTVRIGPEFKDYRSGIFHGPCGTSGHSLLLIGYGETLEGEQYWLLKNSWGKDWGDEGYVKMTRDYTQNGICDLYTRVIYPIPYFDQS